MDKSFKTMQVQIVKTYRLKSIVYPKIVYIYRGAVKTEHNLRRE